MRTGADAVAFVKGFVEADNLVAAICHAPWLLIEADAVSGRRLTSWPSLHADLVNAGAEWVDEELVVDGGGPDGDRPLITSRKPTTSTCSGTRWSSSRRPPMPLEGLAAHRDAASSTRRRRVVRSALVSRLVRRERLHVSCRTPDRKLASTAGCT